MHMHSDTHANGVGRVFRKCDNYNQIRFLTIHPSPLKSFFHVKICFITCLCIWPVSLSVGVPLFIDLTLIKAKSFCKVTCVMVWYSHLHSGNLCLDSRTAEWTPLPYPTLFQKSWGQIIRTKTPNVFYSKAHLLPAGGKCYVCMQPGVYSYSVLSLPRELFLI